MTAVKRQVDRTILLLPAAFSSTTALIRPLQMVVHGEEAHQVRVLMIRAVTVLARQQLLLMLIDELHMNRVIRQQVNMARVIHLSKKPSCDLI